MSVLRTAWLMMFALLCSLPAIPGLAEDFRIESRVYVGEAEEPVNETTTLFYAGRVYDFLSNPDEVTVLDPQRERFLLLNPAQREKVEIALDYVEELAATLKQRGQNREDALIQFMADPEFETVYDRHSGELTLTSEWMTYRVKTISSPSRIALLQYSAYADAYAKLNTLINPAHLPPFARLQLNKVLLNREELPKEVTLTVNGPRRLAGGRKTVMIRSEHHVAWTLLASDRERIERAGRALAEFRSVDLSQYKRPAVEQVSQ